MKAGRQTTLGARATVSGIGVHSGLPVSLTFHPADAGTGVVFVRLDAHGRPEREIRAHARSVAATELATVLGDADSGPCVSTIEHVMAALCGLGVDNAIIEIDGAEAPIMDGSAAAFVAAIDQAGIVALAAPRRFTKVLKPIRVQKGDAYGELTPYDRGFRVDVEIDFAHPLIGRQSIALDVEATAFRREVARARTFGFMKDVSRLWSAGYRARRLDREHAGRSTTTACSIRKGCASPTSSCATRRSTRSAIWRWPARRCSAPTSRSGAATGSITRS